MVPSDSRPTFMKNSVLALLLLSGMAWAGTGRSDWREGLSQTSYGRFGAFGYRVELPDDPQKRGGTTATYTPLPLDRHVAAAHYPHSESFNYPVAAFLTCAAGDRDLYLGHGGYPGRGGFETPLWVGAVTWAPEMWTLAKRSITDVSWIGTALHQTFRFPGNPSYDLTVRFSSAWPAIRLETEEDFLILQDAKVPDFWGNEKVKKSSQYQLYFTAAGLPDGKTISLNSSDKSGVELLSGGALSSNWLLLWQGGSPEKVESFPLLIVFHRKPQSIQFKRFPRPSIIIKRPGGVGAVNLMPLYGSDMSTDNDHSKNFPSWSDRFFRRLKEVRRNAAPKELPKKVINRCKEWSEILLGFPVSIREDFAVSDDLSRVTIRNVFQYDVPNNDWGIQHRMLAVLPPMIPLSQRAGYPMKVLTPCRDMNMVTYLGPLVGCLDGNEIAYELPVPPWGECPVIKVKDPDYTYLSERLSKEMSQYTPPAWAVPNPKEPRTAHYWDPAAQSSAAFWQLATWPLLHSEAARELQQIKKKELFDYMLLSDKAWVKVKDPRFGNGYLMPPTWETDWAVTYALLGLSAYAGCTGDVAAVDTNWENIKGVYSYYRLIHDWPTMLYSSNGLGGFPRTECDPLSTGYEGIAIAAQLAAQTGRRDDLREILYILSKISCGYHSRFCYMDNPAVFWNSICDAAFLHQQTFSTVQGWHPYGPIEVTFSNWGWGMMFIWHQATPNVSASYVRFNRGQADKILLDVLPKIFMGWDAISNATPEKPGNAPPWGYDNLLMMQAALGHRSARQLLDVTEANQGKRIRPGQYVTFQSADVRVFPLLHDKYFYENATWDTQSSILSLLVKPSLPNSSDPVFVALRTERPVEELHINGTPASTPPVDKETGIFRIPVRLPAKMEIRFGAAPAHPKYKAGRIRQNLNVEPVFDWSGMKYDLKQNQLVDSNGKPCEKLRFRVTANGKPVEGAEVVVCRALAGGGATNAGGIVDVPVAVDSTQFTDGITVMDKASVLVKSYHRLGYGQKEFMIERKRP